MDWEAVLRFYLACVEEEDLRTLELAFEGKGYVPVDGDRELLFQAGGDEPVLLPDPEGRARKFLSGRSTVGQERLFYGYPAYVRVLGPDEPGPRRRMGPLFFAEVEVDVSRTEEGQPIRVLPLSPILINVELVRRLGNLPLEEAVELRSQVEDERTPFADRLEAALHAMGLSAKVRPDQLDPMPPHRIQHDVWVNRPILFLSQRSPYTAHLREELRQLLGFPFLRQQIPRTALGTTFGHEPARPTGGRAAHPGRGPALGSDEGSTPAAAEPAILPIVPLNPSQRAAVEAALEQSLTVLTGPPGSGKSQIALALLATAAQNGTPILFASKNNQAVDVVRERLTELLEDVDLSLRLGSRERMEQAQPQIRERIEAIRKASPQPEPQLRTLLDERRAARQRAEAELMRLRSRLGELARLTQLESQARAFVPAEWLRATPDHLTHRALGIGERALRRAEQAAAAIEGNRAGWLSQLLARVAPGWLRRRLIRQLLAFRAHLPEPIQATVPAFRDEELAGARSFLAHLRSYRSWLAAKAKRDASWSELCRLPSAEELDRRLSQAAAAEAETARALLKDTWATRVLRRYHELLSALSTYFSMVTGSPPWGSGVAFGGVVQEVKTLASLLPVWIVTNLSVRRALPLEPGLFDLVVIDEASQCDPASAIPLLFRARRAVIIGDPHQLRHVAILTEQEEEMLARRTGLPRDLLLHFSYVHRSLYSIAERSALARGQEPLWLEEHYRSHPDIIAFSNEEFYGGRLRIRTRTDELQRRLEGFNLGVYWHDVRGVVLTSDRSAVNEPEAQQVVALLAEWHAAGAFAGGRSFGVVSPFRRHIERIEALLREQPWYSEVSDRIRLGTAHRFQGDECDVVIFSPVVAEGLRPRSREWVARREYQLLNVAITRARGALHVVGDLQACRAAGGHLARFAEWATGAGSIRPMSALSRAEEAMAELLTQHKLWFRPHVVMDGFELDFLVVGRWGGRYDVEVDGSHHRSEAAAAVDRRRDAVLTQRGLQVIRIPAWLLVGDQSVHPDQRPPRTEAVSEVLRRLV